MRHGSLFSGLGGFDLAAEWMGWENVFHCEWNEFGQKILKYYWPNAISYNDITKSTFTVHRGTIDILTGGFPCQPFSTAGQRKGTDDSRYLWPEMLRVIREVQPRYIVGENVRGLVNWSGGMVFDTVCADLESEGYEVLPVLLPAAGVNAPHKRDRIFFIAKNTQRNGCLFGESEKDRAKDGELRHAGPGDTDRICGEEMARSSTNSNHSDQFNATDSDSIGCSRNSEEEGPIKSDINRWMDKNIGHDRNQIWSKIDGCGSNATDSQRIRLEHGTETGDISKGSGKAQGERSESSESAETNGGERNAADSDSQMLEHRNRERKTGGRTITEERIKSFDEPGGWETFPTVSPVHFGNDGLSDRLDSITFSKWRKESIKGAGNAIVPQIALQIFKAIQEYESNINL